MPALKVLNSDQVKSLSKVQTHIENYASELLGQWKEEFDKQPCEIMGNGEAAHLNEMRRVLDDMKGGLMGHSRRTAGAKLVKNNGRGKGLVRNEDDEVWDTGGPFNPYLLRVLWMQAMIDPRRNLDMECGYPPVIIPKQYRFMYDREGIAARVVNVYPDECWAVDPVIYDSNDKNKRDTAFENEWDDLCDEENISPLHYLHRTDVLAGIGRYGVLLLGTDDGEDLSIGLPHFKDDGTPAPGTHKKLKILYMRPFDELMCHIINYERNPANPRFGKPVYYHILFADVRVGEPGMTAAAVSVTSRVVHWTRVMHVPSDGLESSEVFGVPRMQNVFNRLCDVRKILGGSAEMFWKGGFPGLSFELMPELATAGVTLDQEALDKQIDAYAQGLQRYISLVGMNAKTLAPAVANPDPTLKVQLEAIAISKGVPLRIFTGSEQAQLASGQDVRTWNRRLTKRHKRFLTPKMVRPFTNHITTMGVIARPKDDRYRVWWPDVNMPDEDARSKICDRLMAAMQKYIQGGIYQIVPPLEFFTNFAGLTQDQAEELVKAVKKADPKWTLTIVPPAVQAAEAKGDAGGGFGD